MTSTPYGSGPPLDPESGAAPVPDERDWNEGQRTTRRAALLTAAGFGLAGLAAFAMVSSPFAVTLDNAQMARADSARVAPRAVPRAGVRAPRAASDRGRAIPGGYRRAGLASPRDAKLGAAPSAPVDAEAFWHKIVDPMPVEPRRHLEQLASVAPTLPEAQYQELISVAADVAWRTDPGARDRAEELVELLSYLTGMEDVKEGMDIHYRRVDSGNTEKAPSEMDPMVFANFVKNVLPSCRSFPTWDQTDVQAMQDATWLITQQYEATHSMAVPTGGEGDVEMIARVEPDAAVTEDPDAALSNPWRQPADTAATNGVAATGSPVGWTYDYSEHQTGDNSVDLLSKSYRGKWARKESAEVKAKVAASAGARLGAAPEDVNTGVGIDAFAEWWKVTNDLPQKDQDMLIKLRQMVPQLTEEDYQRCIDIANDLHFKIDTTAKPKAKELRDKLAFMMDVTEIDAGLKMHFERMVKKHYGVNDPISELEVSPAELAEFVRDVLPAARNFPKWESADIDKMRIVAARAKKRAAATATMGQKKAWGQGVKDAVAKMGKRSVDSRKENAALGQINNAPGIWAQMVDHLPTQPRQHFYQMLQSVPYIEETKYRNMINLANKLQTVRDGSTKATLNELMTKLPYLTGTEDIAAGLDQHFARINSGVRGQEEAGEVSIDRLAEFVLDTMPPIRHWPNWSDDDITRMQRVTNRIQEQFEATHPDWVHDVAAAHKSAPLGKAVDAERVFTDLTSALPAGPRGVLEKLVANTPTIPEEHFQYIMQLSDELATKVDGSTRMSVNQIIDRLSTLADLSDIKAGVDAHFERVDSRGVKKADSVDTLEVSPEKFGKFLQNVLPACRSYPTWTTEDAAAVQFAADFLADRYAASHPGEKLPVVRKGVVKPTAAKGKGVKSTRPLQDELSTASRNEVLDFEGTAAMGLRKRANGKGQHSGKHQPLFRVPAMKSERESSAAKAELGAVVFVDAPTEWARLVDRLPDYEKNKIYKLKEVIPKLSEDKYNALIELADSIRFSSETDGTKKNRIKQLLTDVSALNLDVSGVGVGISNYWARIQTGGTKPANDLDEISPDEFAEFVRETFPPIRDYPLWSVIDVEHLETATNRMVQRHNALKAAGVQPGAAALGVRRRPEWKRRPDHSPSAEHKKPLGGVIPGQTDYAKLPLSEFANIAKNKGKLGEAVGTKHGKDPITGETYNYYEGNFVSAAFDPSDWNLPLSFDARTKWPQCRAIIGTVRDQGKCGSCWAVATAEVMNDRLCIASSGAEQRELSPQYPLSCYDDGQGCQGGDVAVAMHEATTKGMVFGGMLNRSKASCLPYEFQPCEHPCQVAGVVPHECPAHVDDGVCLGNTFKLSDQKVFPKSDVYTCPPNDWACVAQEIMTYGPVAVTFGTVHSDFYGYHSGVYTVREEDKNNEGLGMHATKLIGWGFDEATGHPYWLMMNSWDNWGIHGLGRVGVGEMNMEQGIAMVRM